MPNYLHTRAGNMDISQKRYINTGHPGETEIAESRSGSNIVIELDTILGVLDISRTRNYLFQSSVTNTASTAFTGIHWLPNGKISVSAGAPSGSGTTIESLNTYSSGEFLNIRWELLFPSKTNSVRGVQSLFINGVLQGSTSGAFSTAFTDTGIRFAISGPALNASGQDYADQYLSRVYVNYIDGEYEREWKFNLQAGFEIPNTANDVVDPLKLYGGNGINIIGEGWPVDGSQWVYYEDELSPSLIVPKAAVGGEFLTGQFKVNQGGVWVPASAKIV